jgi:hypothetical protein
MLAVTVAEDLEADTLTDTIWGYKMRNPVVTESTKYEILVGQDRQPSSAAKRYG